MQTDEEMDADSDEVSVDKNLKLVKFEEDIAKYESFLALGIGMSDAEAEDLKASIMVQWRDLESFCDRHITETAKRFGRHFVHMVIWHVFS